MIRRKFLSTACIACASAGAFATLLEGCAVSNIISSPISGSNLVVDLVNFEKNKSGQISFKRYVVVQNEQMQYPICIYRFDDQTFSALLMKCTHQGTELQVFGDKMQCPAHGSEFDNKGQVTNGPASNSLRSFPITISNNKLIFSLV